MSESVANTTVELWRMKFWMGGLISGVDLYHLGHNVVSLLERVSLHQGWPYEVLL